MRVIAVSLLVLLTLAFVAPSFAQKARYSSERRDRLSDPITDDLGLALKVGFHSGCSGCLAAEDGFNWCVHPDNDGVGACVPGACSGYTYNSIFDIESIARVVDETKNFKDGAYICNSEREPAFRTRDSKARVYYGVQDFNNFQGDRLISALSYMSEGLYYNDVNTFSQGVVSNFCNLADDTVIDRTQGGPDFLINAGYEHCLMANSELRGVLERECGPESECFGGFRFPFNIGTDLDGKARVTEELRRQINILPFFLFDTSRFFHYQCDQLRMESQEQKEHYNWIVAALRSVSCANDCHTSGVPVSGVCQHSCTRINEAYTNYRRAYGVEFSVFGPGALVTQFNSVQGEEGTTYEWILSDYVCVPDNTPMCQDVDLKDSVTDYFRSRISPESMSYEEQQLCLQANLVLLP